MIKRKNTPSKYAVRRNEAIFGIWFRPDKHVLQIGGPIKFAPEMASFLSCFTHSNITAEFTGRQRIKCKFSMTCMEWIKGLKRVKEHYTMVETKCFRRLTW